MKEKFTTCQEQLFFSAGHIVLEQLWVRIEITILDKFYGFPPFIKAFFKQEEGLDVFRVINFVEL